MLIDRIWAQQPGKFYCLSTKSGAGKWVDHFFSREEFREIPEFLEDNHDKQIYFCPHGFTKRRRLKQYAVMPKLLWSDLDEADPRSMKFKPTVAIESSPDRYVGLWFTDRPATEELNRAMSYAVGADKSGWDLTQVLRVPGTINYKYNSKPKVRILWTDGPQYKIADLTRKLKPVQDEVKNAEETDAAAVFKRNEKRLPAWVRRELMNGKPEEGKRSEVFWKLGQTLVESGLSSDDIFILLKASPWNKFAGRRNEDEQLEREIDKSINQHMHASRTPVGEKDDDDGKHRLIFRSMDEVEEEEIDWIWPMRIARGEVTIVEGDPGLGKSYLMQKISCCIGDGERLPTDMKGFDAVQGKVLYFDLENSAATVTKKRLKWNALKHMGNFIQCEEPFSIANPDAMDEIYEYIEKVRPVMVVFDTVNTYLGATDAYKGHEVAQVVHTFKDIATRFGIAVVILRHLTKSSKDRAIYRGSGSIQFTGTARIVITVGISPEDPEMRIMAVAKTNLGPMPKALTFAVVPKPTVKEPFRSEFEWGEFVDYTADDIVSAPPKSGNSDRDEAKEYLKDVLDEGGVEVSKLERMAESRGISRRTLHRAADSLEVVRTTRGFGKDKKSIWTLE